MGADQAFLKENTMNRPSLQIGDIVRLSKKCIKEWPNAQLWKNNSFIVSEINWAHIPSDGYCKIKCFTFGQNGKRFTINTQRRHLWKTGRSVDMRNYQKGGITNSWVNNKTSTQAINYQYPVNPIGATGQLQPKSFWARRRLDIGGLDIDFTSDLQQKKINEPTEKQKTNDGNEICFICGGRTKKVDSGFMSIYDVCPICKV